MVTHKIFFEQEGIFLVAQHIFVGFVTILFSRFYYHLKWRQILNVWIIWVVKFLVFIFLTTPIASQSCILYCAYLFYQVLSFFSIVHLNQCIPVTKITWDRVFLEIPLPKKGNSSLFLLVQGKKAFPFCTIHAKKKCLSFLSIFHAHF